MKTSSIAIVAALAAFAGTAVAQDQTGTGQPLKPPAATDQNAGTETDAGANVTVETAPADDTAQAPEGTDTGEQEGNVTVQTITPTVEEVEPATDTAETPAVTTTEPATETAETPAVTTTTETTTMTAGTGQMFIEMQEETQILGSKLMGADVQSAADEDIGDVKDVIMTENGQLVGILVGVGGFLGIGEKDVAIPFERLTLTREEPGDNDLVVTLETTREELEAAPKFTRLEEAQAMTGATTEGVAPPPAGEETGAAPEAEGADDMITAPAGEPAAPAQ